ncbi:phospholipase A(1) DAD1, chloroplastic-like [Hibiscus syriacus]|uniref:phospholipase A(1) DAD1, chloroplastic-like n=1 Tax=Hibiscus syriacus TaxID=106335 RepID=UPI001921ACE9|nr:phospholipase A(1) DAD1, chloroplastic-like [Hibiscus syriacus]
MRVAAIGVTVKPCTWPTPTIPKLTPYSAPSTAIDPLKLNVTEFSHGSHSNSAKLAKDWMEYQGISKWQGLLDPFDNILRSEILKYGRFVEATYRSFDFDPSSPTYATSKFPKNSILTRSCIGDTGYKPTKHLRATSGIQLPTWIDRESTWISTQSSWIGYVAVCHDKEELARLGRRDVVIAFRGTATCLEWLENLRATLTCLPNDMSSVGPKGDGAKVESGFLSLYTSDSDTCPSLQHMVREEVGRVLQMYGNEPLSITITGHSLGAALATLAAYDIKSTFGNAPMVTVISFGGPRVGNQSFSCELEKSGTKILRIVNSDDVITKVPGFVIDSNETVEANKEAGLPGWVEKRVRETELVYAEVGQELRLSSKECPQLSKEGVVSCHDLSTYLHLVNGFVGSNCPFRATALRVLYKHHPQKLAKLAIILQAQFPRKKDFQDKHQSGFKLQLGVGLCFQSGLRFRKCYFNFIPGSWVDRRSTKHPWEHLQAFGPSHNQPTMFWFGIGLGSGMHGLDFDTKFEL